MNYKLTARRLRALAEELEREDPSRSKNPSLSTGADQSDTGEMEILGEEPVVSEGERQWLSRHGFSMVSSTDHKAIFSKLLQAEGSPFSEIVMVKARETDPPGGRTTPGSGSGFYWSLFFPGSKMDAPGLSIRPEELKDSPEFSMFLFHEGPTWTRLEDRRWKAAIGRELSRLRDSNRFLLHRASEVSALIQRYEQEEKG